MNLIFDIGVNHGEDTEFYLAKGFRVVGIEADPQIAAELQRGFRNEIAAGQCQIFNVAISDRAGTLPFYRNLDCDHWSSLDPAYGCRENTRFEVVNVPCVTLADLIARHGCPYYIKIDVEGADRLALQSLETTPVRPRFVSIEEFGLEGIEILFRLGYTMFSLRPQRDKSWAVPPRPPLEGRYVEREFTQRDSGLFGREVPHWLSFESVKAAFQRQVRGPGGEWLPPPGEWYDIHATFWPTRVDEDTLPDGSRW